MGEQARVLGEEEEWFHRGVSERSHPNEDQVNNYICIVRSYRLVIVVIKILTRRTINYSDVIKYKNML